MRKSAPPAVLIAFAAAALCAPAAADVYTWTDKEGNVNVSNLEPPSEARITKIIRAAPKDPAREAAMRDAARQAELRTLNEKVDELAQELEQSRRAAMMPPPMQYAMAPQPSISIVNVVQAPAAPSYPATGNGCYDDFGDCGAGGWPGYYSAPAYFYPGTGFGGRGRYSRKPSIPTHYSSQIVPPLIPLPPGFGTPSIPRRPY